MSSLAVTEPSDMSFIQCSPNSTDEHVDNDDEDDLEYVLDANHAEASPLQQTTNVTNLVTDQDAAQIRASSTPTPQEPSPDLVKQLLENTRTIEYKRDNSIRKTKGAPESGVASSAKPLQSSSIKTATQIKAKPCSGMKGCRGGSSRKLRFVLKLIIVSVGLFFLYSEWTELQGRNSELEKVLSKSKIISDQQESRINDLTEQVARLDQKNAMLLRMADKVVEEEKRNCDFFDVFSIFTSTIGSKREKNLQELCLSYYRFSELEYHQNGSSNTVTGNEEELVKQQDQTESEKSQENGPVSQLFSAFSSAFNTIKEKINELPQLIRSDEESASTESHNGSENTAGETPSAQSESL